MVVTSGELEQGEKRKENFYFYLMVVISEFLPLEINIYSLKIKVLNINNLKIN